MCEGLTPGHLQSIYRRFERPITGRRETRYKGRTRPRNSRASGSYRSRLERGRDDSSARNSALNCAVLLASPGFKLLTLPSARNGRAYRVQQASRFIEAYSYSVRDIWNSIILNERGTLGVIVATSK